MSWPWRSPEATRQALTAKTRTRHPPELRAQRLREIAYRRLLARIFTTQPERWVIKGGAALLLRLDPNRTSNDIDLAYVANAGEHAVALEALTAAAGHDLGDFFTFEIARGRALTVDPAHPLERALSVPVIARVGRTIFAEFSIDLGLPRAGSPPECSAGRSRIPSHWTRSNAPNGRRVGRRPRAMRRSRSKTRNDSPVYSSTRWTSPAFVDIK